MWGGVDNCKSKLKPKLLMLFSVIFIPILNSLCLLSCRPIDYVLCYLIRFDYLIIWFSYLIIRFSFIRNFIIIYNYLIQFHSKLHWLTIWLLDSVSFETSLLYLIIRFSFIRNFIDNLFDLYYFWLLDSVSFETSLLYLIIRFSFIRNFIDNWLDYLIQFHSKLHWLTIWLLDSVSFETSLINYLINIFDYWMSLSSLNPMIIQTVNKVYLSYSLLLLSLLCSFLFMNIWCCVDIYMIELVNMRLNFVSWFMVLVVLFSKFMCYTLFDRLFEYYGLLFIFSIYIYISIDYDYICIIEWSYNYSVRLRLIRID